MGNYYDVNRTSPMARGGGLQAPRAHHGMVSEYQQSGVPFVFYKTLSDPGEHSIITLTLPFVTRWIKLSVVSSGNTCRVGFGDYSSSKGVQGANYILANVLTAITSPLELKCKVIKIYVPNGQAPTINLIAGLTNVRDFPGLDDEDIVGITQESAVTASTTKASQVAIYSIAAAS